MSENARVLVVSDREPWGHRRTREVVRALVDAGYRVIVAASPSSKQELSIPVSEIGPPAPRHGLAVSRGVKRSIARFGCTISARIGRRTSTVRVARKILRSVRLTQGLEKILQGEAFDVVVVEDLLLLPTVLERAGNARIIFDAREYYPGHFDNSRIWRWLVQPGYVSLVKASLPLCDGVTAVSQPIAEALERISGAPVRTVRNVPSSRNSEGFGVLRAPSKVSSAPLKLVYHGDSNGSRRIDQLVKLADRLHDRVQLDLYLVGRNSSVSRIRNSVRHSNNCNVRPPVSFEQISRMLTQYDIGLVYYPPKPTNQFLALPSKFFEYLEAGLPVAIGPAPAMASIVAHYGCGVVADSFHLSAMAMALEGVTRNRLEEMKAGAHVAREELVASQEYKRFTHVVAQVMR